MLLWTDIILIILCTLGNAEGSLDGSHVMKVVLILTLPDKMVDLFSRVDLMKF